MVSRRSLPHALGVGLAAWLLVVSVVGVLELGLGVWSLSDLSTRQVTPELSWFGLLALSSFLVLGLPVGLYRAYRLVLPAVVAGIFVLYFAGFGVVTGIPSAPFVAIMYSWVAAPVVVLAGVVELGLRRLGRPAWIVDAPPAE